jgi:hypothetical protein
MAIYKIKTARDRRVLVAEHRVDRTGCALCRDRLLSFRIPAQPGEKSCIRVHLPNNKYKMPHPAKRDEA